MGEDDNIDDSDGECSNERSGLTSDATALLGEKVCRGLVGLFHSSQGYST
jgi:hypothetical protein